MRIENICSPGSRCQVNAQDQAYSQSLELQARKSRTGLASNVVDSRMGAQCALCGANIATLDLLPEKTEVWRY